MLTAELAAVDVVMATSSSVAVPTGSLADAPVIDQMPAQVPTVQSVEQHGVGEERLNHLRRQEVPAAEDPLGHRHVVVGHRLQRVKSGVSRLFQFHQWFASACPFSVPWPVTARLRWP